MNKRISTKLKRVPGNALALFYALITGAFVVPIPVKITVPPAVFLVNESEYAVMWANFGRLR